MGEEEAEEDGEDRALPVLGGTRALGVVSAAWRLARCLPSLALARALLGAPEKVRGRSGSTVLPLAERSRGALVPCRLGRLSGPLERLRLRGAIVELFGRLTADVRGGSGLSSMPLKPRSCSVMAETERRPLGAAEARGAGAGSTALGATAAFAGGVASSSGAMWLCRFALLCRGRRTSVSESDVSA